MKTADVKTVDENRKCVDFRRRQHRHVQRIEGTHHYSGNTKSNAAVADGEHAAKKLTCYLENTVKHKFLAQAIFAIEHVPKYSHFPTASDLCNTKK